MWRAVRRTRCGSRAAAHRSGARRTWWTTAAPSTRASVGPRSSHWPALRSASRPAGSACRTPRVAGCSRARPPMTERAAGIDPLELSVLPHGGAMIAEEMGPFNPPVRLVRRGVPDEDILALLMANVRTPAERRGDLGAQLAACAAGAAGWRALAARLGEAKLAAASDALLDYAERRVRARLAQMEGRRGRATDRLEGDGVPAADIPIQRALELRQGPPVRRLPRQRPGVRG